MFQHQSYKTFKRREKGEWKKKKNTARDKNIFFKIIIGKI